MTPKSSSPSSPPRCHQTRIGGRFVLAAAALILAAAVAWVYRDTYRVPFLLDDEDSIAENPSIRRFATSFITPTNSGSTVAGRPLLNVSLAINYAIHGTDVFSYHVGNVLIHLAAAFLLWTATVQLLRLPRVAEPIRSDAGVLGWLVALLWAVHPMQTSAVTYIVQRGEALVAVFYLATVCSYLFYVKRPTRLWAAATVLFSLLGMCTKEVMATVPLALLFLDRCFVTATFAETWRARGRLLIAVAATWIVLGILIATTGGRGGSVGFAAVAWWEYVMTQAVGIVRYLGATFWPPALVFDYGAIVERNLALVIPCAVLVVGLLALTVLSLKRWPMLGFAGVWFFLILAPSSSIIPVATQTLATHRMYLPLAALVVLGVLLAHRLHRQAGIAMLLVLSGVTAIAASHRNVIFRSKITLWEDTVAKVPDNVRALNNLGVAYFEVGRWEESLQQFRDALAHAPLYAEAHNNLGQSLLRLGRLEEGMASVKRAVELLPENPRFFATYGSALLLAGRPSEAVGVLEKAVEMDPENASYHFDLANACVQAGDLTRAERHYRIALAANPKDAEFLNNLATVLRRTERPTDALPLLQEALDLQPDSARVHSNLGIVFLMTGRREEGIAHLEKSRELDPALPQARYNLGNAYAESGRTEAAVHEFEALLKIASPNAEVMNNLGVLYAQLGRTDDAIASLERALILDPSHEAARENIGKLRARRE